MKILKIDIDYSILDCEYIDDFLSALSKVETDYILYAIPENSETKESFKYPERVFAYEFYHQYRLIMDEKKEKYRGLYLNGEQPKSSKIWEGLANITPDLVLHGKIGEKDDTGESQKWLCEIKMKSNPAIIQDLKKIKSNESVLKFQDNFFLYVGATLQNLKDVLDKSDMKQMNVDTICVCLYHDDDGIQIACRRLLDIINSINS